MTTAAIAVFEIVDWGDVVPQECSLVGFQRPSDLSDYTGY